GVARRRLRCHARSGGSCRLPARQKVVEMRRIPVVLVLLMAATVWPATNSLANGAGAPNPAPRNLQAHFNSGGFADLAVGVPAENAGAIDNAGAVNVLYGTAAGLTGTGSQLFTQDTPGGGSAAEA